MTSFTNPDDDRLRALFKQPLSIAVIGLSPKPARPSSRVARAMQQAGHTIIPVRPAVSEVLGEKAHARLLDLPDLPDIVNVFRAPEYVDDIVDSCIALGCKVLWLQEGVINLTAAQCAQAAGMLVIMDKCLIKEYRRLAPS
ncbi:MAG: CoA-binding protein [Gammaproteobacteria bacterium]|nr:MAG: CoA-binding protein [Gammaproteobacteria bacterium]